MRRRFLLLVIVAGMFGGFGGLGGPGRLSAVDASFQIVAQEGVGIASLKRTEVSAIYLKKKVTLGEGIFVVPVDLPVGDPVRQAFSIVVHGRGAEAIDVFWNRQLFSGRGVPPVVVKSSEEALSHLLAHADAIAYVSGDVELPPGLQVLPLVD